MTEVNRVGLKGKFQNGDRPDETDFGNLIDSCLNKVSDGVSVDTELNLLLPRGLILANSAATTAGGLRFNGGQVQFHNGTTWSAIGASAGAFATLTPTSIAYNIANGTVGIGSNFSAMTPPTFRLEVNLGDNSGTAEQVRFGNAVIANGFQITGGFAVFSHRSRASDTEYALRQSPNGATHINARTQQVVSIRQNDVPRLGVSAQGTVIVGGEAQLADSTPNAVLQVAGDLFVRGTPFKPTAGGFSAGSDARVKEDVHDLQEGLAHLRRVRTVRFRYNGRGGTRAGQESVGVIGQEIEKIFPETITRIPVNPEHEDGIEDMRFFDPSALTFVLINAVKELADKVDRLERALAAREVPA